MTVQQTARPAEPLPSARSHDAHPQDARRRPVPRIRFRPVAADRDTDLVHRWLTHPAAAFWQMGDRSPEEIREYLQQLQADPAQQAWVGEELIGEEQELADQATGRGPVPEPLVYVETYDPARVLLTEVFDAQPGDLGMHLLTAPPPEEAAGRRSGLTSAVMGAVIGHCLSTLGARRIVVEPDAGNSAILRKNAEAGFEVLREVDLPDKRAMLSVLDPTRSGADAALPGGLGTDHLRPGTVEAAQRHLVAKALAEFSHEHLLEPARWGPSAPEELESSGSDEVRPAPRTLDQRTSEASVLDRHAPDSLPAPGPQSWQVTLPGGSRYTFRAELMMLNHWVVEESSVVRRSVEDGRELPLDVQEFVAEAHELLGIPERLLGTYLEELASTVASAAYKRHRGAPSAPQLARGRREVGVAADFQQTEAAMEEGHPCFVATNGRIGFGLDEFRAYAPEAGRRFRYVWLAALREHARLETGEGLDEETLLTAELDEETRERFAARLSSLGLDPGDYLWMPVHPWQFQHRIAVSFAPDLASRRLVVLGEGPDGHQPQQSIRTAFNAEAPERSYIKTALSIQNMGFLRGLSPAYMRATPAINDWVASTVRTDPVLARAGFDVLREHAAVGYTGDAYHRTSVASDQQKMLAALWRESPLPRTAPGERLMTLAALLHRDVAGDAVLSHLIDQAGIGPAQWLRELLEAYLIPVVHCLEVHELAFMPHGENIVLRLRQGRISGAFLKDIGEEAAVIGPRELDEEISRIRHVIDDGEAAQIVFTDVFSGVLRHVAAILHTDEVLGQEAFWSVVSQVLAEHREGSGEEGDPPRRRRLDLQVPRFEHSCLNRLQLRNTLEMVDLQDASGSLIYAGELTNPIGREP